MSTRRNRDKHTAVDVVEDNIVSHLRRHGCGRDKPVPMSVLGEVGLPDYAFRNALGAALSVARIVSRMVERQVLRPSLSGHGYYLADIERSAAAKVPA